VRSSGGIAIGPMRCFQRRPNLGVQGEKLLGSGVRLFDHLAGTPVVLGNPTVIAGAGVTHLRYPVRRA
jgi:hypothetical protein